MATRKLYKKEWKTFFDRVSKMLEGRPVDRASPQRGHGLLSISFERRFENGPLLDEFWPLTVEHLSAANQLSCGVEGT